MGAATFDKEQLDAIGAISLDEFAAFLSTSLPAAGPAAERTQTPLALELLRKLRPTTALMEIQSQRAPQLTCEEESLIMQQEGSLPRSTGELIRLSIAEHVSQLELNNPSHFNALSMEMASDMQAAAEWLAAQGRALLGIVVQGAGDHFCPGVRMSLRVDAGACS
jgi:hypothetical protein